MMDKEPELLLIPEDQIPLISAKTLMLIVDHIQNELSERPVSAVLFAVRFPEGNVAMTQSGTPEDMAAIVAKIIRRNTEIT